jgi:hypothetical protein
MKIPPIKQVLKVLPFIMVMLAGQQYNYGQATGKDTITVQLSEDIRTTVHKEEVRFQRWWYGWLTGYSAATIGQGVIALTTDNNSLKQDMALGAATTFLGAAGQLLTPMYAYGSPLRQYKLEEEIDTAGMLSQEKYEALLKALALREKEGRSWKIHAVTGVVNLGTGLITWLGFKRTFMDGVEIFAINTVITEAQIWTQPIRAVKEYQRYLDRTNYEAEQLTADPGSELNLNVFPGGISVTLTF